MAETNNPIDLLLNRGEAAESTAVVQSPAFSLTKVLATAATVLTPLSALLVQRMTKVEFSSGEVVALTVAVLAFLAVAAAADVLARGLAAAADSRTKAAGESAAATRSAAKEAATAAVKVAEVNRVVAGMQRGSGAPASHPGLLRFDPPIPGCLADGLRPLEVHAVVTAEGKPTYFCAVNGRLRWLGADEVTFTSGHRDDDAGLGHDGGQRPGTGGQNGHGPSAGGIWMAVGRQR